MANIKFCRRITMKNFQCKKCGTHLHADNMPSIAGCPSGGSHTWIKLGDVGSKNYQCKKCSTLLQVDNMPSIAGCPSGGSHTWKKL
jgi:predicted  nucleic acid-binding Zn-ribbon protein